MVYINGQTWLIKYVENGSDALTRSDGTITIGSTDFNTRIIYLSESLTGALLEKVLIHELCHAELFERNITCFTLQQEEALCDFVATFGPEIIELASDISTAHINFKRA